MKVTILLTNHKELDLGEITSSPHGFVREFRENAGIWLDAAAFIPREQVLRIDFTSVEVTT